MAGSAELLDLAETEGTCKKPTKAMEFSPQVTQFLLISRDFSRFLGVFMGFLEVKPEILRTFLEKFWKDV